MVYETPSGALLVTVYAVLNRAVLEPEHLAYFLFVEPYDDLAVYYGGRGWTGVNLYISCIAVEVGTDVLLGEFDTSLR
jgi:hypothetical protein